jgi:hypothetical protein
MERKLKRNNDNAKRQVEAAKQKRQAEHRKQMQRNQEIYEKNAALQQSLAEEEDTQYGQFVTSVEAKHEAAQARKQRQVDKMLRAEEIKASRREESLLRAAQERERAGEEAEVRVRTDVEAREEEAMRKVRAAQKKKMQQQRKEQARKQQAVIKNRRQQNELESAYDQIHSSMGYVPKPTLPKFGTKRRHNKQNHNLPSILTPRRPPGNSTSKGRMVRRASVEKMYGDVSAFPALIPRKRDFDLADEMDDDSDAPLSPSRPSGNAPSRRKGSAFGRLAMMSGPYEKPLQTFAAVAVVPCLIADRPAVAFQDP